MGAAILVAGFFPTIDKRTTAFGKAILKIPPYCHIVVISKILTPAGTMSLIRLV